ncbi:hypothetical protein QQS21_003931 [Conoideocrella luteorostrata]|uniref:Nitroreductase domain-containing protein n=1 Tax=Conoideocrella luteorostrata TaxID=1105319 RepID=A0AAJ0G081_9HYPO|nr:hypothetical protein QQS21_003931 [Conoideocrella luteorostrata]
MSSNIIIPIEVVYHRITKSSQFTSNFLIPERLGPSDHRSGSTTYISQPITKENFAMNGVGHPDVQHPTTRLVRGTQVTDQREHTRRDSFESYVHLRRSVRFFKSDAVPRPLLQMSLQLAQRAPSNSNIQPWRVRIASSNARDRIVGSLHAEALKYGPSIPPLPKHFHRFRSELGSFLYGKDGYNIAREDKTSLEQARMRNYEFFGAPVCAVVSIDETLAPVDVMTVGMFLQTFILALAEKGLGTCLLVSVTGYSHVLKREFGIDENQHLLCGIAIGWPMEDHKVNNLRTPRESLDQQVTFIEE